MPRRIPARCASARRATGTTTQLSGELFAEATGIRLEHVPYRGSAPSLTDMLAGRVQMLFDSVALPAIRDGRLLGLAMLAERRNPEFPDLPTIGELGHLGALAVLWFGVVAPATPRRPVVDRLAEAIGHPSRA